MKKGMKIALVVGAVALILGLGLADSTIIRPFGDPPFLFMNI